LTKRANERAVNFSKKDYDRIRTCSFALGTSMAEFIEFATLQAVDECEGLARESQRIRDYYQGLL
jgi:hypothetical protein